MGSRCSKLGPRAFSRAGCARIATGLGRTACSPLKRRATAAIAAVAGITAIVIAQTPPRSDRAQTEAQQKRAAERIAGLQKEAESLATQEQTLLVELRKLEVERQLRQEELTGVQRSLGETERQLRQTTARAAALQAEADQQRPDVEARLVRLY